MPLVTYTGPKSKSDPSTRVRVRGVGVFPLNVPVDVDDEDVPKVVEVEGHNFEVGEGGPKLTGKALDDRGAELQIEGFTSLSADEKRAAVAKAEAAANGDDGGDD